MEHSVLWQNLPWAGWKSFPQIAARVLALIGVQLSEGRAELCTVTDNELEGYRVGADRRHAQLGWRRGPADMMYSDGSWKGG